MSEQPDSEAFRDHISTVDDKGKRVWVYPKKPKGRYTNWRSVLAVALLALLFGGPFIRIGGEPMLQLNILERKFTILGNIFWPQDFFLFVIAMVTGIVFVILFTVVFGRLFCGWVCPQTIFMEMVFRKVEYLIEGDFKQQRKLNKQPWNFEKLWKKTLKHAIFLFISFLIGNTFLAYIIGSEALIAIITEPVSQNVAGFSSMLIFSGMFYGVFAWLREQVCTTICPYGRLQGVLLDRNSMVVAYDYVRGEIRAKFRKNEDREVAAKGDCIDCNHCVDVCPTGIDIRNGTQLECVNCTACMDACDNMMDAVGLKRGLIGYKSEATISEGKKFTFSPRIMGYSLVLLVLLGVMSLLMLSRSDVETSILRTAGIMYQTQEDGRLSNLYNVKVINKTNETFPVTLKLENIEGEIRLVGEGLVLKEKGVVESVLFIVLERDLLEGMKTNIEIGIYHGEERIETVKTNFLGPAI